jgi:hypothetical protein
MYGGERGHERNDDGRFTGRKRRSCCEARGPYAKNTYPPQVDVSASKNRKTGNKRVTSALFISSENTHIAPSQQITVNASFPLSVLLQFLIDMITGATIQVRGSLTTFFPSIQICRFQYSRSKDIQTYYPPVDRNQENTHLMTAREPVFEGGQKKDGKRPPPGKPDTSKIEKPGREGDKGSQRVKQPKKERPQQA